MIRAQMICQNCIKYQDGICKAEPVGIPKAPDDWCAMGEWQVWRDGDDAPESFFWGDWRACTL